MQENDYPGGGGIMQPGWEIPLSGASRLHEAIYISHRFKPQSFHLQFPLASLRNQRNTDDNIWEIQIARSTRRFKPQWVYFNMHSIGITLSNWNQDKHLQKTLLKTAKPQFLDLQIPCKYFALHLPYSDIQNKVMQAFIRTKIWTLDNSMQYPPLKLNLKRP